MLGYVDGSLSCPPESKENYEASLARKFWLRQDCLILQAIQASLAGTIAPLISSCSTSSEFRCLEKTGNYICQSLQQQNVNSSVHTDKTSQDGQAIADYMQTIKTLIDDLALIGHPLSDAGSLRTL